MPNRASRPADRVRTLLERGLSSTWGDGFRPVRALREVLGTANDLLGRPLATPEELERRGARRARAEAERPATTAPVKREAAPVLVYFDGKDHRTLKRVEDLLIGRAVPYRVVDCTDDEAGRSWAVTTSKQSEFPLVFVAGEPVGGLHEVVQADVNGDLARRVFGA